MPAFKGWMPDKSLEYLEGVEEEYTCKEPRAIAARVKALAEEHDDWRRNRCLNLNPSENAISPVGRARSSTWVSVEFVNATGSKISGSGVVWFAEMDAATREGASRLARSIIETSKAAFFIVGSQLEVPKKLRYIDRSYASAYG
ncbi:MAG: hypothetical protein Q8O47_03555 [Candidatus Bathyarchaeota archaeon]|nr:hypothetical protein [Candidatus Bathyarchaeota archaeon]